MTYRCGAVVEKHRGRVGAAPLGVVGHLCRPIVTAWLWLLATAAFASFPATTTFTSSYGGMTGPTAVAACTAAGAWLSGRNATYNYVFVSLANLQSGYADCVYDIYYKSGAPYYANNLVGNARLLSLPSCPTNSVLSADAMSCTCKAGYAQDPASTGCLAAAPEPTALAGQSCKQLAAIAGFQFGAPILPATAEKYRFETDWSDSGPSPLAFTRTYRSLEHRRYSYR